jgi:hypothetical protein
VRPSLIRRADIAASAIAEELSVPGSALTGQSLASGSAGVALLHVERARAGLASWQVAHTWLARSAAGALDGSLRAGLFFGVPAVAFAIADAAADTGQYARALATLDQAVADTARRRVELAHRRIDSAQRPVPSEFDVISGLAGIGAYLLSRPEQADVFRAVLSYLVRLTEPLRGELAELPGWWSRTGPDGQLSARLPYGHGGLGLAHGVTGPLALLALSSRSGVSVPGQVTAINTICEWLDSWRQGDERNTWWPEWVTRDEEHTRRTGRTQSIRPSWCYGLPGIVRAQHLAGLATGDAFRARQAVHALEGCVQDSARVDALSGASLCHGLSGLIQVVVRVSADSPSSALADSLPGLVDKLTRHPASRGDDAGNGDRPAGQVSGLLEGRAGVALALQTAAKQLAAGSCWDRCLLIA